MDVISVRFDLREDVPADVGHVYVGKQIRKEYTMDNIPALLEHIEKKVASTKKSTQSESVSVCVYGFAPPQILMAITANLCGWDDVCAIEYGNPHALPVKIYPIEV